MGYIWIMKCRYAPDVKTALSYAREEALNSGSIIISTTHLLLGITRIENDICTILLKKYGFNTDFIRTQIIEGEKISKEESIPITRECEIVLKRSSFETYLHKNNAIEPIHILLTILRRRNKSDECYIYLDKLDINYTIIQEEFLNIYPLQKNIYRKKLSNIFLNKLLVLINASKIFAWV